MGLEEILVGIWSFASLFGSEQPRFNQHDAEIGTSNSKNDEARFINASEIERDDQHENNEEPLISPRNLQQRYGSINYEPTYYCWTRTFRKSLSTSFTIKVAVLPLCILIAAAVYLDLNTTDLCFERMRREGGFPHDIMKWRLIGDTLETIIIFLWFPFTLAVLLDWKKFRKDYLCTIYISLACGSLVAVFKVILFFYQLFQIKQYYSYVGNALFFSAVLICSYLVARKIHRNVALSKLQISIIISTQFVTGFIIAMTYMYAIVACFNGLTNDIIKAMVALITPIFAVLPTAVCRQLALKSSKFADSGRSFVLIYYLHGVVIVLYRTMQADVKSIWIFIGLSILHGIIRVAKKATKKYIEKIWTFLMHILRRLCCGHREIQRSFSDKLHELRLNADLDIQSMLYEYTSLILVQIYFALYLITNFEVSSWLILKSALIRIAIAVGIDFFFNCLAIFIQMYWYGIPVAKVWFKHWRLHLLANAFLAAMTVMYFSPKLLEIVQVRIDSQKTLNMTNCTKPFQNVENIFTFNK